jgi:hypothetical protein
LFEFKMSYKEPGYHQATDPPFVFPPKGVSPLVEANLIDIEGKNGTGKTTLLNCLALAMGYLDQEKELETKPALRRKLQALDENRSLQYSFRINTKGPESIDLRIERDIGQKPRFRLNSKQIDPAALLKMIDLIFLTEDDPEKVVNASLKNLARFFNDIEKGLMRLQDSVNKHLQDIDEFQQFKTREESILKDIRACNETVEKKKSKLKGLQEKLQKAKSRDEILGNLQLLKDQDEIVSRYKSANKKYEDIKGKTGANIVRELERKRFDLRTAEENLKEVNRRIEQICTSLKTYDVSIDSRRLLANDYAELNELSRKIRPQKTEAALQKQLIDEMYDLFQRYRDEDVVPLINKSVREVKRELLRLKAKVAADRVFSLLEALDRAMNERKEKLINKEKILEKMGQLSQRSKDARNIDQIQAEFSEAQKKYVDLQVALKLNRIELLSQWKEVEDVVGNQSAFEGEIGELQISIGTEQKMRNKCEENLRLLRENATKVPKHEKEEKKLRTLYKNISSLRERVIQWIQILNDPKEAKAQLASVKERPGFSLGDYQKFVTMIGEYLGNQFEPVPFDNKLYDVRFFDIEKEIFTTKDQKQISLHWLSQGQNKIVTLTASLKKIDPSKKGIVLIDEIADLDPEKLQSVKNTLKEKFAEGSVLLAVLVRPPREFSDKMIEIKRWG